MNLILPPNEVKPQTDLVRDTANLSTTMQMVMNTLQVSLQMHSGRPEIGARHVNKAILQLAAHCFKDTDLGLLLASCIAAQQAEDQIFPDVGCSIMEQAIEAFENSGDSIRDTLYRSHECLQKRLPGA